MLTSHLHHFHCLEGVATVVGPGSLEESENVFATLNAVSSYPINMISFSDYANTTQYKYTTGSSLYLRARVSRVSYMIVHDTF